MVRMCSCIIPPPRFIMMATFRAPFTVTHNRSHWKPIRKSFDVLQLGFHFLDTRQKGNPNLNPEFINSYNLDQLLIFKQDYLNSNKFREALEIQLVKKNLYMVSKYYRTVRIQKLAVLFDNSEEFIEDQLCKLIQDGLFKAKIDRMNMIVNFGTTVNESEAIDQWVDNINGILDLVNFVAERIEREEVKA